MTEDVREPVPSIARRLLLGAGATGLVMAGLRGQPAAAEPGRRSPADGAQSAQIPQTIASSPISGYVYRYLDFFDFTPEDPNTKRVWAGSGVYADGVSSKLWGSMEISPGSYVREVEWYYYNPSANVLKGLARLWVAGTGDLNTTVVDLTLPSGAGIQARRAFVQTANAGPFPTGVKLALAFDSTGKAALNGVRVGFSGGNGATGMLASPVRAYDSRSGDGKVAANTNRTLTLPSASVPSGTSAVAINLTAVGAAANGFLKVYAANAADPPAVSSINFSSDGSAIANALVVGVSSARQIKVFASTPVHVIVDLLGTIS